MKKGDLLSLLRSDNNKKIQVTSLYQIARQAAAGMVYLQDKNIVHRDLALSMQYFSHVYLLQRKLFGWIKR